MDFSKLKGLVPVKKANINRDSTNRTRSKTSNMTPHAIKCEVFFYDNTFYGIVDNERYPIDITDEDYQKATFAFSTPDNEHWDWFTIRPFSAAEANIENLKKYWQLIVPKMKIWITLENGVGKLDMERINNRNEKVFKRLSSKYYASRRN